MKKSFFTAIAMIAFSSASMANTIAKEEESLKNETTTTIIEGCSSVWSSTVIYCRNRGLSKEDAECIAWSVYRTCLGTDAKAVNKIGVEC